jgi:acetyl-CoA acyltransferase
MRQAEGREVVIVEAVRTPIGRGHREKGYYKDTHPNKLLAKTYTEVIERSGVDASEVEDVIAGCVQQFGEQGFNIARNAWLEAGLPIETPGTTVDRQCGSSQQAVHFAAAGVISGQYDVAVAGGVESMTRVPMGASIGTDVGFPFGPKMLARYEGKQINQGLGAEMIAERWGLSREQVDEFSLHSHEKAAAAVDSGAFAKQYAVVPGTGLEADEGIRRETTLEKLGSLKSAFKDDGVITAGNSSQISDGTGALLITTSEKAAELGLKPLVRLHSFSLAGDDPVIMLTGPIPATAKVLKKSGLSIGDIGAFEINEAFAPVPMAWLQETGADPKALNPLGGAIAIGHPLGGSGAILMTRLVHHMVDNGIKYGLQSMCEGGGMANATILELL